jgi:hypothetical protein
MTAMDEGDRSLYARVQRLAHLLRWRYPILAILAIAFSVQHLRGTGADWHYFADGSRLLFGEHRSYLFLPGGLHMYASYPELQIGPLAFLVATPLRFLGGGDGRVASALLMTLVAPVLVFLLERTARAALAHDERGEALVALTAALGGLLLVQAWSPLATIYAHLDDVLVLSAFAIALWALVRSRPEVFGTAVGLGIAAKPWAVIALPLLLVPSGRARLRAVGIAVGIGATAWLPFILADSRTLSAIRPAVTTAPASVLHLLGASLVGDAPGWVRPVQLGTALILGLIAVRRGRWGAVLLVGVAVRIALDPQVFLYYSAGLVFAALAWDLLRSPKPLPLWTFATVVLLNDAYVVVHDPTKLAVMRLIVTAAMVGTVILAPRPA